MTIDRRQFAQLVALAAGAAIIGAPDTAEAQAGQRHRRARLVVDHRTGKILHRSGACATRVTPCSTFKVPLALMGFDAGILKDAHRPAWDYVPARDRATRDIDKQRTDPTSYEANSVIWYSREITRRLGAKRFKAYVDRFGYGNRDVRGNPGRHDGLTHSWLESSLRISPDEQVAFIRKLLNGGLATPRAHRMTQEVLPDFAGAGGWSAHGKTGSGDAVGWFVGWADKGDRRVVFAALEAGDGIPADESGGPFARAALLREIDRLAG
jgi:beta-lactamase class D